MRDAQVNIEPDSAITEAWEADPRRQSAYGNDRAEFARRILRSWDDLLWKEIFT